MPGEGKTEQGALPRRCPPGEPALHRLVMLAVLHFRLQKRYFDDKHRNKNDRAALPEGGWDGTKHERVRALCCCAGDVEICRCA